MCCPPFYRRRSRCVEWRQSRQTEVWARVVAGWWLYNHWQDYSLSYIPVNTNFLFLMCPASVAQRQSVGLRSTGSGFGTRLCHPVLPLGKGINECNEISSFNSNCNRNDFEKIFSMKTGPDWVHDLTSHQSWVTHKWRLGVNGGRWTVGDEKGRKGWEPLV